jgi:predicted PurR-regulated permease PerM
MTEGTTSSRALRWSIFIGAAALVVYLCFLVLFPFLNVIAWSAILSITFYPVYLRVEQRTGRAAASALLTSALVVLIVLIPLLFIAGIAVRELRLLGMSLQAALQDPEGQRRIAASFDWLTRHVGVDQAAITASISQHTDELTRGVGQYTLSVAGSIAGAIVSFVFIIFAMFLMLRDGEGMLATIPDLLPFERARSETILHRMTDVVHASVYGVVVIAVIQGVLAGAMFALLGIPSAALWGLATVITSVVPLLGAAAIWLPATVYLLVAHAWIKAIVLAIWGAGVVSTVDNFLRPRLVAGRVGLSELTMFFALLGGLRVFGLLGIVLGPLVFALGAAMFEVFSEAAAPPRASTAVR